ncbi:unnamed protein product [Tuber aestivum]|uniref:PHD-type domain-containing protein n=1 Tax=Tuber aestivum TaxID=59557 RepID=A0A292PT27_9PEZI|nr:unnamed protein product [Tuber aestivum]
MGEQTTDIPLRPPRNPNNAPASSAAQSLRRSTSSTLETNRRSSLQTGQRFSPQLKWHNTLQQDFTGQKGQTGHSEKNLSPPVNNVRKRHSGSFDRSDAIILSHVHGIPEADSLSSVEPLQRLSSSPLPSPSKRQRALGTSVKTPTKTGQLGGQSGNVKGSGLGMQTPPPSSTATARKRGRPQKKKSVQNSTTSTSQVLSPPHTSPSKASEGDGRSGTLHNRGNPQVPVPDIRFPSSVPDTFDEYLSKESAWNGGLDYSNGMGVVGTEGESSDAYDWSSMRANVSDVSIDGLDVFGSLVRDGQSSPLYDDPSDSIHFSFPDFDDDLLEKSILPLDVDPNLIFSSAATSVASSMRTDEIRETAALGTASQPYQHQHLQHLREQELELQRQRIKHEKLVKERRRQERAVTASGGRGAGSQRSLLKHSMSDSLLSRSIRRPTAKAADFDAAVTRNSVASARKVGLEKRNATPPPPMPPRSVRKERTGGPPRGQGPITVKAPKMRTEVTLAISPGGRAKTETTIVYESSDTEVDEVQTCDSFEESDSSFDDDEPRGLGPDGKEYIIYRERNRLGPVLEGRSALQRRSGTIFEKPTHTGPPPRTPTRRSPVKLASSTGKKGLRGFVANTAAAATATSGRLDSSPRLPTPLRSSPPASIGRHLRECVRRASGSSFGSSRALVLGTPTLGSMHEVSDESEAETVVDGTDIVNLAEDEAEEDDGDAMVALKKVMLGRRRSEASLDRTPTKARPGSAVKPKFFSSGSSTTGQGQRSVTRHSQIHPGLLLRTSAVKKKLFVDQAAIGNSIVRPRRKMADGGFSEASTSSLGAPGPGRLTPVKQHSRSDSRKENIAVEEDSTRCVCKKTNEQGGTTMVQCDSCKNWLHMKCIGYSRKTLPKVFVCDFCAAPTPQVKSRTARRTAPTAPANGGDSSPQSRSSRGSRASRQ